MIINNQQSFRRSQFLSKITTEGRTFITLAKQKQSDLRVFYFPIKGGGKVLPPVLYKKLIEQLVSLFIKLIQTCLLYASISQFFKLNYLPLDYKWYGWVARSSTWYFKLNDNKNNNNIHSLKTDLVDETMIGELLNRWM